MKTARRAALRSSPGYPVPPMTTRRHALATLVAAALALAAPAAALAQNAGDEQYADPFGKVQHKKSGSGTQQGSQGTQQGTSSGQGSSQPSTQGAPATSSQTATAAPAQQTLPRTGAPVGLFAATGAAMLCGGAALRRRVPLS